VGKVSELSKVSKVIGEKNRRQKTEDRRWEGVKEGSKEAGKIGKGEEKITNYKQSSTLRAYWDASPTGNI
jgi:hypothetical protein